MVVSRKRNNNKGVKQKNTSSLTGSRKEIHHDKPKEPLEIPSCIKVWAGPNDINDSNGKRKAQSELNISHILSCSFRGAINFKWLSNHGLRTKSCSEFGLHQ